MCSVDFLVLHVHSATLALLLIDELELGQKYHLGQYLLGPQTDYDFDLYVTLTVKVKLLNLAKIVITLSIMDRFA